MVPFSPQGLLFSSVLLIAISECTASSSILVSAVQEKDVALPCVNSALMHPYGCNRVRWMKYSTDVGQMKVIFSWPGKFQYDKRVSWKADGNGQMSLFLTNVKKSDEGLYSCEICQGWDCTLVKNISLRVKECEVLPAMKVAPSTPIKLNCPVDITLGQEGPQNISWLLLKGDKHSFPKNAEMNDTSLVFTTNDSAWYRCKYIYKQTQRCFDIKILVRDALGTTKISALISTEIQPTTATLLPNKMEEIRGTFTAVVSSVITGLVIITALTGVCIYCRRKRQGVTWQDVAQREPTGARIQSLHDYEAVSLAFPNEPSNQQINSLYASDDIENICTFHY